MKTDDLDRLRTIAPERHERPALFTAAEREALFAAAMSGFRAGGSRPGPRWTRSWAYRLAPLAAMGAVAAAVAVLAFGGAAGLASHGHAAASSHRRAVPRAITAAYVTRRARMAVAGLHGGTLRVTFTSSHEVWRYVENLSNGANRATVSRRLDGPIQADYSSTARGPAAIFTEVYYPARAWWTEKGFEPGPAGSFSAQSLRQELAARALVVVGHDTVDGQSAIHLRYTRRTFTENGKKYAVSSLYDVWVDAATFLPIHESDGKSMTNLTWSSQPPTAAQLTAIPPAEFTHLDGPPPSLLKTGGGVG